MLALTKPYSSAVANASETSKWAVHSAEQPSERECDRYSRIRLFFDGVAQCPLKGTGGVGGAVDGLVIEILGGIRHFTGLFLGISSSTVRSVLGLEVSGISVLHWNRDCRRSTR